MVLAGLKAAFTPRGGHILSIFSLMPLTYGRHMIFSASSFMGGGGGGSSLEGLVEGMKTLVVETFT